MKHTGISDITTNRLKMRKLKLSDADAFYQFASDTKVTKYMNWIPHTSISDSINSIEKSIKEYENKSYYRWGISLKENDHLIGIIQLLAFDETKNSCSFAYMLNSEYQTKGYGTEALSAVIQFAFKKISVEVIEADIYSENKASSVVAKKCGMIYNGTIKDKYTKDGILHRADRYTITREQYINLKNGNTQIH
ncbi:MAG: GNAT family N-acetyltransferase [Clostridia bacterium]|nr:GNAT family N-acetyltransferase [Clostridia bacterium]